MKTIVEMAREADLIDDTYQSDWYVYQLSRFADLVTEQANAKATSSWTLMCKKMVAFENKACQDVCDDVYRAWTLRDDEDETDPPDPIDCKLAIRARGNT